MKSRNQGPGAVCDRGEARVFAGARTALLWLTSWRQPRPRLLDAPVPRKLRHSLPDRRQRRSKGDARFMRAAVQRSFCDRFVKHDAYNIQRSVGAFQRAAQREIVMQNSLRSDQSVHGARRQFARPRWLARTDRRSPRQDAAAAHLSAALGTSISTSSVDTWLPRSILTLIFSGSSVI
jgi:hypothetical protein